MIIAITRHGTVKRAIESKICFNADSRLTETRMLCSVYYSMNTGNSRRWWLSVDDVRLLVYRRYNLNPKKIARFNELLYITEIMVWYIDTQWINNYVKLRKQWNTLKIVILLSQRVLHIFLLLALKFFFTTFTIATRNFSEWRAVWK